MARKVLQPPPPPPLRVQDPTTGAWHEVPRPPQFGGEHRRGPKPKYTTGDELLAKFAEYRADVDSHPWFEVKSHATKDDVHMVNVPRQRPYTLRGFKMFASISETMWHRYKHDPELAELGFATAAEYITDYVYQQKFEGAALGFFKERLITRDLGMSDRVNTNLSEAIRGKTIPEAIDVVLEAVACGQFSIEDGERFIAMLKSRHQLGHGGIGGDEEAAQLKLAADAFVFKVIEAAKKDDQQ